MTARNSPIDSLKHSHFQISAITPNTLSQWKYLAIFTVPLMLKLQTPRSYLDPSRIATLDRLRAPQF
jgi:hypothetical protein